MKHNKSIWLWVILIVLIFFVFLMMYMNRRCEKYDLYDSKYTVVDESESGTCESHLSWARCPDGNTSNNCKSGFSALGQFSGGTFTCHCGCINDSVNKRGPIKM